MCSYKAITIYLLSVNLTTASTNFFETLNQFFTKKTALEFESVLIIHSNTYFCLDNALCQSVQTAFENYTTGIHSYDSVLNVQNVSISRALVALLDFEERINQKAIPRSYFSDESLWILSVRNEEELLD